VGGIKVMRRFWRSVQRQPALFAAAVLVVMNIIALSGVLHLSGSAIGGINAGVAAILAFLVGLVTSLQLSHVRRRYITAAREAPASVVPTAGGWISDVVGRDDLCYALIESLRDPATRRPQVLIGDEGAGKTAVLVRLTKLLAEGDKIPLPVRIWDALRGRGLEGGTTGKVPVPIRLRDAQSDLDFSELARARFLADTDAALLSAADGERVWRQLRQDDKIVVLADGLEEALIEGSASGTRDDLIHLAVRRANTQRLPLIIASRPHDPLRGMDIAIVELDQLSAEAAFEYVLHEGPSQDEYRLEWIVETASIAQTPFYMQIARQLNREQLIQRPSANRDNRRNDQQLDTRSVDQAELRLRLLQTWKQALVNGHFPPGVALSREDRVATIDQLSVLACIGLRQDTLQVELEEFKTLMRRSDGQSVPIIEEARKRLKAVGHSSFDVRLAATWGTQLQLVEAQGSAVRFPHSILQAYLGSRLIGYAMADREFRADALANAGRELLIALVMHSKAKPKSAGRWSLADGSIDSSGSAAEPIDLRTLLRKAAGERLGAKVLDLYATALEIDSVDPAPEHQAIATEIAANWQKQVERDPRTLEPAKLNLVRRFGEAARTITQRRRWRYDSDAESARPAYRQLFEIACREPSYPVRLAAAHEIGAGGDDALAELAAVIELPPPLHAAAGRASGRTAGPTPGTASNTPEEETQRRDIMRAWLAPQLVGSATARRSRETADGLLKQWLDFVHEQNQQPDRERSGLSVEIALAQGFKYAANRRDTDPEARDYLIAQARDMLKITSFWFSRLTLLHALCLASLRDSADQHTDHEKNGDHSKLVAFWLGSPDARSDHPFVTEASWLAAQALESRQPARYIWIDESAVASRPGSRPARPGPQRKHNLWILPSTGWAILHPRAKQLVADVVLLLNLAERGRPSDRDGRLRSTNRNDLPPCLARDPSSLDPTRTVGMAASSQPGTNCRRACPFELCPYPPKGALRTELSVAFCRRQQALVSGIRAGSNPAPQWRKTSPADLRRFWNQMSQRG
jgi:hypothetical protein